MSARQICNAALPLKPLIHKTLLSTLIIHILCVCARARGTAAQREGEREGGRGNTRAPNVATHIHIFQALSQPLYIYSIFNNKLVIF